jgi:clan AA aspartic protease
VGTFSITIDIGDPQGLRFESIDALVDTGATLTTVPAPILRRLGVVPSRRNTFRLANDQRVEMDMGETKVRVEGMETTTWVLFGDEGTTPLLGAMTLEGLLLGVDPFNERLVPVEGLLMSDR